MKTSTSLLLAVTLLLPATALAVPQTVGFSARLADNGRPVTGTHAFKFKVFDAETGGTELWGEEKDLAVADGIVTTALGDTVAIDTGALFTGLVALYLEVTVDEVPLSPRMALQSVPFALRAQSAAYAGVAGALVPRTSWVSVPGRPCTRLAGSPAATEAIDQGLYCAIGTVTAHGAAYWPVFLPHGAALQGMQVMAYAPGTITCELSRGTSNWGSLVASASKAGYGWAFGTETAVAHVVDATNAYFVRCVSSGTLGDAVVGSIRFRLAVY